MHNRTIKRAAGKAISVGKRDGEMARRDRIGINLTRKRAAGKAISVGRRDGEMARQDRIGIYCELDGGRRKEKECGRNGCPR